MRPLILIPVILLVFATLFAGCTTEKPPGTSIPAPPETTPAVKPVTTPVTIMATGTGVPLTTPGPADLTIRAFPEKYIPLMSSTVGIGLTPHYTGPGPVVYSWNTSYGYFISWNSPDWNVNQHGNSIDTTNETVFWTYSPDEMGKAKPPVTIRLIVKTPPRTHGGNGTIAWKDLHLTWEQNDTAVVTPAACGIQNCHGMEISCGPDIVELCTMEYQLGDKCRGLASCGNVNGSCTVIRQEGYEACVSCVEECNRTSGGDPVRAFDCESRC